VKHSIYALLSAVALAAAAPAQFIDHTFDHSQNPDGWVAWDQQYSAVSASGGNPLEYVRLNNLSGPTTCQYVFVEPRATTPLLHRGNWRAAGVEQVSADIDIRQGRFGGIFCVFLVSDPGTPTNLNDDCTLVLIHPTPAPFAPGWRRYEFDLPSASLTAAPGWFASGPCASTPIDQVWNSVLIDVDRMFFVLDAIPGAACTATNWDLGIDNISVQRGTLGTVFCASRVNSTGQGAELVGTGSKVVAQNDVDFRVTRLPQNSFGYFLMSQSQGRTPVFSGDICLRSNIVRFAQSVLNSGSLGSVDFSPNLAQLPLGVVIPVGSTWNFQYWFRDVGPTANFSEAMSVRFE